MKNRLPIVFALALGLMIMTPFNNYALLDNDQTAEVIKLYLGEAKVMPVNNLTRVAVGNPSIADVINVSKDEITLNPKAKGSTTLVVWDSFGEESYQLKVLPKHMDIIKDRIDSILQNLNYPGVYTKEAEDEDKILLLGNVKEDTDKKEIMSALGTLKDKIVDLIDIKEVETSIEIDAQILEMNRDASSALGMTWPGNLTVTEVNSPGISTSGPISTSTQNGIASTSSTTTLGGTSLSSLFHVSQYSRNAFTWSLDALVTEGRARILSRPRLTCQSGKEAELIVGGEVPTFSTFTNQVNTGVQIEYKEYGIKLKIKPTITEENRIKLVLYVEVSDIATTPMTIGTTTGTTGLAYPLSKRSFNTELYLNDGQTLMVGGLIKKKETKDVTRTPFLSDIPILGAIFRHTATTSGGGTGNRGDTELFVTLTPTIMNALKNAAKKEEAVKPMANPESAPIPVAAQAQDSIPDNIRNYASIVQKRILDNLLYPSAAKQSGFEGTVKLKLHLSYLGQLLDVTISSSSGYKVLDDNALAVAKSVSSYPPFPPTIQQADLWVEVPVVYRLD